MPPPAPCWTPGNSGSLGCVGTVCGGQRRDLGQLSALTESLGNILNEQTDHACLPRAPLPGGWPGSHKAIRSHGTPWEGGEAGHSWLCAFTSVTSREPLGACSQETRGPGCLQMGLTPHFLCNLRSSINNTSCRSPQVNICIELRAYSSVVFHSADISRFALILCNLNTHLGVFLFYQ